MSGDEIDVVFLGVNDAGMRVYDWLCDRAGVFVHAMLTRNDQLSVVRDVAPDWVVACGYRHVVPPEVLEVPEQGCINLHSGYLPYNRGANPNVWSIVEGTPAGVSLHYMTAELDQGDIVARRKVETDRSDDARDLFERLEDAQVDLFRETWPDVEAGTVETIPQSASEGTYHTADEFEALCELDPDETFTVVEFLDRLRALTFPPYDNAYVDIDGERYYVEVDIDRS